MLLAFVVPSIVYVLIFFAYPLIYGLMMSLENFGFEAVLKGAGHLLGSRTTRSR